MEKTPPLPGKSKRLSSFLSRNKARLMGKLGPDKAASQIDSMLFMPTAADKKAVRLPRGFEQFVLSTNDGKLQAYQAGKGPTVVFVHGWGGGAHQFFPLMRGLAHIGFSSLAFDHLGHGLSDRKPGTLHQSIRSCNDVFEQVRKSSDGLCALVGHSTGCISIANSRAPILKDVPLLLIAPVFNYKRYYLKRLVQLGLPADMIKQYAAGFSSTYRSEYQQLELARKLAPYRDVTAIAHDESDSESAVADSVAFCKCYPLTRLIVTKDTDHVRIVGSESVWQELKSLINYDDTTTNFDFEFIEQ
jgi:esterase/lipase